MSGWQPPAPPAGYTARNRHASNGGPSGVQRSSAAQLKEQEPLFTTYEHLAGLQRGDAALAILRKVASMVKPIMRKRGWRVQVLAEFLPPEQNLLGLNINRGYKICLRLRYHHTPDLFLPTEEILDTLLHELSHNVWGEHDSNFHKLWDELRDEAETLMRKGYTGEGFLGSGQRLGGYAHNRALPPHDLRRLARESAETRKAQGTLMQGSGQRLGGRAIQQFGSDVRKVIADQITRRNTISKGCASGRSDASKLSEQSSNNTFKTKAEEDDANNRAIAQALYELMEEEEEQKLNGTFMEKPGSGGLEWSPENGLYNAGMNLPSNDRHGRPSEEDQLKWAMEESTRLATPYLPAEQKAPSKGDQRRSAPPVPLASKPPSSTDTTSTKRKQLDANLSPKASSSRREAATVKAKSDDVEVQALPSTFTTFPSGEDDTPSDQWSCEICTCINPLQFLACDACGVERPQSVMVNARTKGGHDRRSKVSPTRRLKAEPMSSTDRFPVKPPDPNGSLGWNCFGCGAFMEHKWWTCSAYTEPFVADLSLFTTARTSFGPRSASPLTLPALLSVVNFGHY
ncbi:hypothetical protein AC579_1439 [Pseudocercospora musae]|uniref:WLM domain-containing protein n=1 Tax=Pseudocercospora musae TaxID=113226 RepID=A0A139IMN4_9PEZI|nr:hypothetical protein AC579_1439 [Pseudocercospora musae]